MVAIGIMLVLAGTCLWGTLGPVERQLFQFGITPVALSLVRASLPALALTAYAVVRGKGLRRCLFEKLPFKIANGFFGIVGLYVLGNFGFLRIPVAQAMIIFYTAPFWVLLLAHFGGKEPFSPVRLAALMTALSGIWIALGGHGGSLKYDLLGVGAMVLSGFSFAMYLLNGRYGIGNSDPFGNYLSTFFWGAVLLWIIALPTGELDCLFRAPLDAWPRLLFLSLGVSMGGYGIVLLALRMIPSGAVSILSTAEIFFAGLWSWILLGEIPDRSSWIGAGLIVAAVAIVTWESSWKQKAATPSDAGTSRESA